MEARSRLERKSIFWHKADGRNCCQCDSGDAKRKEQMIEEIED